MAEWTEVQTRCYDLSSVSRGFVTKGTLADKALGHPSGKVSEIRREENRPKKVVSEGERVRRVK